MPHALAIIFAQNAPVPGLPAWDIKTYAAVGGGALFVLIVLVLLLRRKAPHDPERGLSEDLGTYPPAPSAGQSRLLVQGVPMRLRLVVIAPMGKKAFAKDGDVEPVLDDVVPGMGDVAAIDKPRVRIWPPQLSVPGFAPMFWRLTKRPANQAGNWVLVAGAAKASGQPILLGLALWSDKPTKKGQITLEPNQWTEAMRVG